MRNLKIKLTKKSICKALMIFAVMTLPILAFAGDGSDIGGEASKGLLGYIHGGMGKLACVVVFSLGIIRSVATQTIWPCVAGFGLPLAINYGPNILIAMGGFNG